MLYKSYRIGSPNPRQKHAKWHQPLLPVKRLVRSVIPVIAVLAFTAVPMPKIRRIRSASNLVSHLDKSASMTKTAVTRKQSAWRIMSLKSFAATIRREKSIAWTIILLHTCVRLHHVSLSTVTVLAGSTAVMGRSAWSWFSARTWLAVITKRKRRNAHRPSAMILKNA